MRLVPWHWLGARCIAISSPSAATRIATLKRPGPTPSSIEGALRSHLVCPLRESLARAHAMAPAASRGAELGLCQLGPASLPQHDAPSPFVVRASGLLSADPVWERSSQGAVVATYCASLLSKVLRIRARAACRSCMAQLPRAGEVLEP